MLVTQLGLEPSLQKSRRIFLAFESSLQARLLNWQNRKVAYPVRLCAMNYVLSFRLKKREEENGVSGKQ